MIRKSLVTAALFAGVLLSPVVGTIPAYANAPGGTAAALTEYYDANEQLATLLDERAALEAAIATAMSAEREALNRLSTAEEKVAVLAAERTQALRRQRDQARRLAEAEAQVPALAERAGELERRIAVTESWLFDGAAPRALSMRGYAAALDARDRLDEDQAGALRAIDVVRQDEAQLVLTLGRLNTEIGTFERQADALSRQVGAVRARALNASAKLGSVHKKGQELSEAVRARFDALRQAGHPVGIVLASTASDLEPIPAPLAWPATAPRGYALPAGATAAALRLGEPLQGVTLAALQALPPFQAAWVAPVKGPVTTPYGDATPYQSAHWALDVGARLFEPVRAPADGIVEFAGLASGENRLASYGMVVLLRHGERVTTLLAHLDDRAHGLPVQPGDAVKQGQVIGYVGLSGYSTGPHLHFEVRLDGQPIDPLLVVKP
jgi:murein DD-endopeptidase MepM/ murein hydrolase activator NlpD